LWDRLESWRLFSGFFNHRGWRCAAIDVSGAASLAELRAGLAVAIESLEAPPVIVGHDLGALLALDAAARARAVVALSPLGTAAMPALRAAGSWLARRRGVDLGPPRGAWRGSFDATLRSVESPRLLADVAAARALDPVPVPALVMSGTADPLVPAEAARAQAAASGADLELVEGGHLLHRDEAWEKRVAIVHRWLVRNLGADLLVLYEEAMADRDESGA
jgi:pimeloyl-ACP methyl ester carboxylesterase